MTFPDWVFFSLFFCVVAQILIILFNGKFFSSNPHSYIEASKKFRVERPFLGRAFLLLTIINIVGLFFLFISSILRGILLTRS